MAEKKKKKTELISSFLDLGTLPSETYFCLKTQINLSAI